MNRRQFFEVGAVALAAASVGYLVRGGSHESVESPRDSAARPSSKPAPRETASARETRTASPKPKPAAKCPTPDGQRLLTPGPNGKYRHRGSCGNSGYEDDNPVDVPVPQCGMARMNSSSHSFLQNLTELRRKTV